MTLSGVAWRLRHLALHFWSHDAVLLAWTAIGLVGSAVAIAASWNRPRLRSAERRYPLRWRTVFDQDGLWHGTLINVSETGARVRGPRPPDVFLCLLTSGICRRAVRVDRPGLAPETWALRWTDAPTAPFVAWLYDVASPLSPTAKKMAEGVDS